MLGRCDPNRLLSNPTGRQGGDTTRDYRHPFARPLGRAARDARNGRSLRPVACMAKTFAPYRNGLALQTDGPDFPATPPTLPNVTPSTPQHLSQNVLENASVPVVLDFLRRVDSHARLERDRLAAGVRHRFDPNGFGRAVP